jgi:hypothetical protein
VAKAGKKHSTPETPLKAISGLLYGHEVEVADAIDEPHGNQYQGDRVRVKLRKLFGDYVPPPEELADADLVSCVQKAFDADPKAKASSLKTPDRKTILRAAGRL